MTFELDKVCHVMRRFSLGQWGGTESSVLNVSRQLQARDIPSLVFTTDMFEPAGEDSIEGVPVHRYHYSFPWLFLSEEDREQMVMRGGSPLSMSLFLALLKEPNLSLIHTHVQGRLGGMARTVARWRRIPYLVSIHAGFLTLIEEQAEAMREPFKDKWEWGKAFGFALGARRTLEDADGIICVGKDEFEQLQEAYPEKRIYYLPNGVNASRFSEATPDLARKQYGLAEADRLILCVSRIDEQKNQKLLVSAFARYLEKEPNGKLILVGPVTSSSYKEGVLKLAESKGIADRVQLVPGLSPDDPLLPSLFRAAHQFILPSKMEPFGIVILEAWAAAVPVIASRVGGIPGFTRNRGNALLFGSDNEEQLLNAMLSVSNDHELRERLIQNGLQEAGKYDWPVITDRLIEIYHEVGNIRKGAYHER